MTLIGVPTTHPALQAAGELRPLQQAQRTDAHPSQRPECLPRSEAPWGRLGCLVSLLSRSWWVGGSAGHGGGGGETRGR